MLCPSHTELQIPTFTFYGHSYADSCKSLESANLSPQELPCYIEFQSIQLYLVVLDKSSRETFVDKCQFRLTHC